MTRIKAIVEYEGTHYHGFQRQPGLVTIESTLLQALEKVTGESTRLWAAGRTDAGVHARGQVIAFDTNSTIPPERFAPALNSVLPSDIRMLQSEEVRLDFHPRYHARAKLYRYLLYRQEAGRTFYRNLSYYYPYALDEGAIKEAAAHFVGTHDFRAFCASGSQVKDFIRTIFECKVNQKPPFLWFDIRGDGFLYNMVRIIVGTLLAVGNHRIRPAEIEQLLRLGRRDKVGSTVPASGLYLMKVFY